MRGWSASNAASIGVITALCILWTGLVGCGPARAAGASPLQCGTVATFPNGHIQDGAAAQKANTCFWNAFQQCQLASITYNVSGVDTITSRTFTVEPQDSTCAITDTVQHQIVPNPPRNSNTYTCSTVTNEQGALRFTSCGEDGDITLPTT